MDKLFFALLVVGLFASPDSTARALLLLTDDAPPHMIKATDSGIDIDITREVLASIDYRVKVEYAPLERAVKMVRAGQADITLPTFFHADGNGLYISSAVIEYKPTVFTLAKNKLAFDTINSIDKLNVYTFQGAPGYFGKEFEAMTLRTRYQEMHDMSVLPSLLFMERADVVVLDYYIFHYYAQQNVENYTYQQVKGHNLIPPVKAYAAFHNIEIRNLFNQALAKYQDSGKHLNVIRQYIGGPD